MENDTPERILNDIERQQLELYAGTTDESTPWWYFPLLGLGSGATIASFDLQITWLTALVAVISAATIGAAVALVQRRAGFSPRLSALPAPLKRRAYGYMAGVMVLVLAAFAYAAISSSSVRFTVAGAVATLILWVGGPLFERAYRARAHELARLAGIDRE